MASKEFVSGFHECLVAVEEAEESGRMSETLPLHCPTGLAAVTYVVPGSVVKDPADSRRDSMGQWSDSKNNKYVLNA